MEKLQYNKKHLEIYVSFEKLPTSFTTILSKSLGFQKSDKSTLNQLIISFEKIDKKNKYSRRRFHLFCNFQFV